MHYFYINDRKIFSDQSFSVNDLLIFLNLNIDLIVIEYNKIILPKSLWKQTVIKNNDEIEFVLRLQEMTANLDALTGGAFSASIR